MMKTRLTNRTLTTGLALCGLLLMLTGACSRQGGKNSGLSDDGRGRAGQGKTVNWADSAKKRYMELAYYYNNNIHDTLVMMVPGVLDFCKSHELWADYYDTWMLLGEEYNFRGEHSKAISVAQQIHTDAVQRGDKYGLTVAEFLKAMVYDGQMNHQEATRSFERALASYPPAADPFLKNTIYVYYVNELKNMGDLQKMRLTLDQWYDDLSKCRADSTIPHKQISNWLYYYHHSCYSYYLKNKEVDKAAMHVDSVVKHIEVMGWSKVTRNEVMGYRTQLALERKDYAEALRLSDEQLPLAKELDINAYAEVLKQRALIMSGTGRWKEAFGYLDQRYKLVDSLNQDETRQQLNELNKRFELDELKMQAEREHMQSEQRQLYMLIAIAALVVIAIITYIFLQLRAARRLAEVKARQGRMESELHIARNIQMSMVPSTFPHSEWLDMYASMVPAREVGGDLYGYVMSGSMLYFCVGDVSGKGMPASLFMAQATRLFQTLARQGMQPAEICTRINDALSGDDNENGMFVTLFVGLVDLETGHLWFCNAGHNPPVIGGTASHGDFLKMESNAPLGLWSGLEFVGEEVDSIKGRPLFIYTDGLNEAENRQQEQFGEQRLLSILRSMQFETSQQVIETLTDEVERHRNGAEPNDDLTMMCIRVIDLHRCLSRG